MSTREVLPLPNGGIGTVTITLTPQSKSPCALLDRLERAVATQVGDQKRTTSEVWELRAETAK